MPVFAVAYDHHCFREYKKVSHLPSQLGIFVFTFTVKRFHIYGTLLHLALKVFTFTGPYYIFTFRGATICHLNNFKIAFLKVKTLRLCLIYTLGVLDSAVRCAPCNVPESSDF